MGIAENSSSIIVSWSAPATPNGVITEYQLQCYGHGQVFNRTVKGSQTTTTLSGLLPYSSYSCNITAHTSVGGGPAATMNCITKQNGEYSMKHALILVRQFLFKKYSDSDGCPSTTTSIPSASGDNNLMITITWPETNLAEVAVVTCPCGTLNITAQVATRRCGGSFINGTQWDTANVDPCNLRDNARRICRLSEVLIHQFLYLLFLYL